MAQKRLHLSSKNTLFQKKNIFTIEKNDNIELNRDHLWLGQIYLKILKNFCYYNTNSGYFKAKLEENPGVKITFLEYCPK